MFRSRFRWKAGQRAQSAVETAIIMPLNVFIILGIIQQGLIAQARVMAKYAAYRAVRVGVMNNARTDMMTNAALTTLLPVLAFPSGATGPAIFPNMKDITSMGKQILEAGIINNTVFKGTFLQPVKVVVCGPLQNDVASSTTQNAVPDANNAQTGDANQIDFDDPRAATEWSSSTVGGNAPGFHSFMRTKLRIQVQFLYPMVIPFANSIIEMAYLGLAMPDVMRMQTSVLEGSPVPHAASLTSTQAFELWAAAGRGQFLAPIAVSYAMRMQSNFYLTGSNSALPKANNCSSYAGGGLQ
jgi:hypothetical protein